jgi:hypothetical protein
VGDSKRSSELPILKPDNRRYSLYTITCCMPYSNLLPVLGREWVFPTNITATLDAHLAVVLTSKLLLQSACGNDTVKCCRRSLILTSPASGKEKIKTLGLSSSFAFNLTQFFSRWSTSKRSTDTEPRKADDLQWVVVPAFRPLLKWKCVSSSLHFRSFRFVTSRD